MHPLFSQLLFGIPGLIVGIMLLLLAVFAGRQPQTPPPLR
jgi:putative effector of murein hydrolase LrgA (UPF0299 family)